MSAVFSAESFPNRFDHAAAQQRIYAQWETAGYFHAEPDSHRRPYSIVIPPPNVTGALHLGHALNNTLQDILIRMKRMQGFNTLWMPGTDHAGIATQAVVEKRIKEEEGKTRHDLGRAALVQRIWAWKDAYETRILQQLKSMGCSCDWQRLRFTLDETCARAVRRTFFDLFQKQRIYRGKRLVNWDTFLQTAVSDDEVFHEPVKGHFWHIQYPVLDPLPGEPTHVTIATTRPETLLGDTAVAVHPDPAQALAHAESELRQRLAAAPAKEKAALAAQLQEVQRRRSERLPQLEQLRDMARAGRKLQLPLLEREIPLVADPWAKPELGSGCVKVTPAHDANDYEVAKRCGLPMINILHPDGTLNHFAGPYQGQTVAVARKRVVADLEAAGLVSEIEDREIDLAHSDRSKTPIEPYLADQWFVRMEELAESAMNALRDQRIRIVPARYGKGYLDWLSEKRDWPVSRQLWWGHRIPIWSRVFSEADHLRAYVDRLADDPEVKAGRVAYQAAAAEDNPGAGTDENPPTILHICLRDDADDLAPRFEKDDFVQVDDVLDTWFSSALWPHSTLGWPVNTPDLKYFYPTSVLITSRDIITLWVARMVLTGLNNMGEVPFRDVYIHPKILDGYGETMSKSKGNGVDPIDVLDKFGPDALRFGLAHLTTETQDVRMPVQFECPHCEQLLDQTKKNREMPRIVCPKCQQPFQTQWARTDADRQLKRGAVVSERFEGARNFCNKLWNAARFVMLNLENYTPGSVSDEDLAFEDHWILSRLTTVTQQVTEALEQYRYADAARTLYDFCWVEFCSSYIEMIKSRFQDPQQRVVAQRIAAYTLDVILRLLHPVIPFITEEIWQLLGSIAPERGLGQVGPAARHVIIAPWPQPDPGRLNTPIEEQFALFHAVLSALREIRSRQNVPPRQSLAFALRCDEPTAALLQPLSLHFAALAEAQARDMGPNVQPPTTNATVHLPHLDVYVDLSGVIDVEAEKARLEKQLERLSGMITGKEKQLNNSNFVERAPAEVVLKERESLLQLQEQRETVRSSLAAFGKNG
ncbi:MAG: class I tRNA ligase family protein [Pirellulaceae bacterium]